MFQAQASSRSPLILLFLIAVLVFSTLVMLSILLRPSLEFDFKNRIIAKLYSNNITNAVIKVEGRGVVLKGVTSSILETENIEAEIQNTFGVHQLQSKLLIGKVTIKTKLIIN